MVGGEIQGIGENIQKNLFQQPVITKHGRQFRCHVRGDPGLTAIHPPLRNTDAIFN